MSEQRDAAAAQWMEDTWQSQQQRGGPWEEHSRRIRDLVRDGLRLRRTKSRGVVRWTSAAGHEVDLHDHADDDASLLEELERLRKEVGEPRRLTTVATQP